MADNKLQKRLSQVIERVASYAGQRSDFTTGASPVEMLVGTILSQNTNDRNSYQAYRRLREVLPDWDAVADASVDVVADAIRIGGLADQKARSIINALRTIRQRYGSFDAEHFVRSDDDALIAELTALPGVGVKTASCVLMFSLGRDVCPVDTHVHRVVNRLGIVTAGSPDATFKQLRTLLPKGTAARFHVAMIQFGRSVCKAQRPHCFECPLYDLCKWKERSMYAKRKQQGAKPVSGDFLLSDHL